jgi:hypothetical protein
VLLLATLLVLPLLLLTALGVATVDCVVTGALCCCVVFIMVFVMAVARGALPCAAQLLPKADMLLPSVPTRSMSLSNSMACTMQRVSSAVATWIALACKHQKQQAQHFISGRCTCYLQQTSLKVAEALYSLPTTGCSGRGSADCHIHSVGSKCAFRQ